MRITGIDTDRSSSEAGVAERYLILDGTPSVDWNHFFAEAHKNYWSMQKRRAHVDGNFIVVTCHIEELQGQIIELNKQCAQATEAQENYAKEQREQFENQERASEEQRRKANDIYGNLKF